MHQPLYLNPGALFSKFQMNCNYYLEAIHVSLLHTHHALIMRILQLKALLGWVSMIPYTSAYSHYVRAMTSSKNQLKDKDGAGASSSLQIGGKT